MNPLCASAAGNNSEVTEEDAEPEIPPELREQLERFQELRSTLKPAIEARLSAVNAALESMRPAIEAAQAAARSLRDFQNAFGATPDLTERIRSGLRRAFPPNWDPDRVRLALIRTIVAEDGIPIVWVPRAAIVSELMAVSTRDERLGILNARDAEVIEDCTECLTHCSRSVLADNVALAQRAMDAYTARLYEPSQALAVVIAETIITQYVAGGPGHGVYKKATQIAKFRGSIMLSELRRAAAIAPIERFYTEWYAASGNPPPPELSRHVSVHHPSLQQYSRSNALLAVMLLVSLLREVTEWEATSADSA
jgi:hypothetical protein